MIDAMPALFSILICTRNRREMLVGVLESLRACRVPQGWSVELVVVDNGSTDGTSELVRTYAGTLPFSVQCVAESTPGLGQAHAAGLAACRGQLIACTDDDCYVSPDWCEAIVRAFETQPEINGLFGRVLPVDEGGDPAWHVAIKTSEDSASYRFPCWPIIGFGNNMAFRRTALESVGGFNPRFGPGGALWSAEELELTYRLLRAGHLLHYAPSVVVRHRTRGSFASWASTHRRDALGFGAFTGSYTVRGDLSALKLMVWEWQGMFASWWRGVMHHDRIRRQVSGWYVRYLPFGFLAGVWYGLRRHPAPRLRQAVSTTLSARGDATPEMSVVVATRDRAEVLRGTLRSLFDSAPVPPGGFEIVVVDNGSHDHTRAVVEAFRQEPGPQRLVYVYEPRTGTSQARNTGIAAARGAVVAFTDDDCVVSSEWVSRAAKAFAVDRELDGLFGRVLPLNGQVGGVAVSVKTDEAAKRYRFPCSPFVGHGNNMAFRRQALLAIGAFDVALGPGAPLRAAEELEMAYRLLRRGSTLLYEPSCVVSHRLRNSSTEARATEWRNAIGVGACFGQHVIQGDLFALKCVYWFLKGLVRPALDELQSGGQGVVRTKWLFFFGVPWGLLRGAGHALGRGKLLQQAHGVA